MDLQALLAEPNDYGKVTRYIIWGCLMTSRHHERLAVDFLKMGQSVLWPGKPSFGGLIVFAEAITLPPTSFIASPVFL